MKATHRDYLHPRHLRVVYPDGETYCVAPSANGYRKLFDLKLPVWTPEEAAKHSRHSSTQDQ